MKEICFCGHPKNRHNRISEKIDKDWETTGCAHCSCVEYSIDDQYEEKEEGVGCGKCLRGEPCGIICTCPCHKEPFSERNALIDELIEEVNTMKRQRYDDFTIRRVRVEDMIEILKSKKV